MDCVEFLSVAYQSPGRGNRQGLRAIRAAQQLPSSAICFILCLSGVISRPILCFQIEAKQLSRVKPVLLPLQYHQLLSCARSHLRKKLTIWCCWGLLPPDDLHFRRTALKLHVSSLAIELHRWFAMASCLGHVQGRSANTPPLAHPGAKMSNVRWFLFRSTGRPGRLHVLMTRTRSSGREVYHPRNVPWEGLVAVTIFPRDLSDILAYSDHKKREYIRVYTCVVIWWNHVIQCYTYCTSISARRKILIKR